jgi:hypothetical protein
MARIWVDGVERERVMRVWIVHLRYEREELRATAMCGPYAGELGWGVLKLSFAVQIVTDDKRYHVARRAAERRAVEDHRGTEIERQLAGFTAAFQAEVKAKRERAP